MIKLEKKNKTKSQPKTISRITHQQRSVTNVVEIRTKRRRRRCTHVMGSWIKLINIDHRDDWEIAVLFLYTIEFIVIINFKCSNRIMDALAFAKWTKTKNRITNVLIFILQIIPSLLQSASPLMMMICSVSLVYGCLLPHIQSKAHWVELCVGWQLCYFWIRWLRFRGGWRAMCWMWNNLSCDTNEWWAGRQLHTHTHSISQSKSCSSRARWSGVAEISSTFSSAAHLFPVVRTIRSKWGRGWGRQAGSRWC